jgi:large subunit ribosomal protein L4
MVELDIYKISGEKAGSIKIEDGSLGEEVSPALMHRAVVSYEANLRQGSSNTKTRGDRKGSGKKLWKQKGTGRARVGSIRSPLWRGGGVIFGPKPRDFSMKLSKKEKTLALRGAIRGKILDNEVKVVEDLNLSELKTKKVSSFLKSVDAKATVLFVSEKYNPEWLRASGNVRGIATLPVSDLNALSFLKYKEVIFEKNALESYLSTGEEK